MCNYHFFKKLMLNDIFKYSKFLCFCSVEDLPSKDVSVLKLKLQKQGLFLIKLKLSEAFASMPAHHKAFFKPLLRGSCSLIYSLNKPFLSREVFCFLSGLKYVSILGVYYRGIYFNLNRLLFLSTFDGFTQGEPFLQSLFQRKRVFTTMLCRLHLIFLRVLQQNFRRI